MLLPCMTNRKLMAMPSAANKCRLQSIANCTQAGMDAAMPAMVGASNSRMNSAGRKEVSTTQSCVGTTLSSATALMLPWSAK
ncbi:MAG: hypothetical protein KatS3mg052_2384 [Candidatus Roseilinea sp.]|nr:MAG: hypothetical protein KatS3mg052_2384 [Candidatus Roseilinea sp.]